MGYTTDFSGSVDIQPPLNEDEISFLDDFNRSRRMHRTKGPLFVKGSGMMGQGSDADVLAYNNPDPDQPGLWCQWVPDEYADPEGSGLTWDGGEKFYNAAEWMEYIVNRLLSPAAREYVDKHKDEDPRLASFTCDHVINGTIEAEGEESGDLWQITVTDNVVDTTDGKVVYGLGDALPGEHVHEFHGWTFEITSVGVDVRTSDGPYVLTKVSLEEAVDFVGRARLSGAEDTV